MDKVIIFSRVSTSLQDNESQTNDLFKMVKADGYSNDQIIIIEEKESATKLSFTERQGIVRLFDTISTEPVKCVYIWEVSRLARREDVGWQVLMSLRDHNVNLKVYKEAIQWLNDDGNINESARLAFGLFFSFASGEAEKFRARSARGRAERVRQNKALGWVLFGYSRDKDGNTIIDEVKADFIRKMYDKYATENIGAERLRRWCESVGYPMSLHQVQIILKNEAYRGSKGWQSKYANITYPRIVDEELWRKVEEKRKTKNLIASKYTKWQHLTDKLCRCPQCGDWMVSAERYYVCRMRKRKQCDGRLNVLCADTDWLAWEVAKPIAQIMAMEDVQSAEAKDIERKKELLAQMNVLYEKRKSYDEKRNRIEDIYIDNGDKAKYEKNLAKLNADFQAINKNIEENDYAIKAINRRLEDYARGVAQAMYGAWLTANDELSSDEKSKIIHQVIRAIYPTKHDGYVWYLVEDIRGGQHRWRIKQQHKKFIWEYYIEKGENRGWVTMPEIKPKK